MKLLNAEKTVIKGDYGFDEAFNISGEIYNKYNKINEYKPRISNKINTKNAMLEYLKIIENNLIDISSAASIAKNKRCQLQRLCG